MSQLLPSTTIIFYLHSTSVFIPIKYLYLLHLLMHFTHTSTTTTTIVYCHYYPLPLGSSSYHCHLPATLLYLFPFSAIYNSRYNCHYTNYKCCSTFYFYCSRLHLPQLFIFLSTAVNSHSSLLLGSAVLPSIGSSVSRL